MQPLIVDPPAPHEVHLYVKVRELLRTRIVFGQGSSTFGLKRSIIESSQQQSTLGYASAKGLANISLPAPPLLTANVSSSSYNSYSSSSSNSNSAQDSNKKNIEGNGNGAANTSPNEDNPSSSIANATATHMLPSSPSSNPTSFSLMNLSMKIESTSNDNNYNNNNNGSSPSSGDKDMGQGALPNAITTYNSSNPNSYIVGGWMCTSFSKKSPLTLITSSSTSSQIQPPSTSMPLRFVVIDDEHKALSFYRDATTTTLAASKATSTLLSGHSTNNSISSNPFTKTTLAITGRRQSTSSDASSHTDSESNPRNSPPTSPLKLGQGGDSASTTTSSSSKKRKHGPMYQIKFKDILSVTPHVIYNASANHSRNRSKPSNSVISSDGNEGLLDLNTSPTSNTVYYIRIRAALPNTNQIAVIEMKPLKVDDEDCIIRWCAALQFRTGLYDAELNIERSKVTNGIVGVQKRFRGRKGRKLAERIKVRTLKAREKSKVNAPSRNYTSITMSSLQGKGVLSRLVSNFVYGTASGSTSDSSLSDDEDNGIDDEEEGSRKQTSNNNKSNQDDESRSQPSLSTSSNPTKGKSEASKLFLRGTIDDTGRIKSKFSQHALDHHQTISLNEEDELKSGDLETSMQASHPRMRRGSLLEHIYELSPLQNGEIEDEIWENQRWQALAMKKGVLQRGWSAIALLPSDPAPFSDRLGRGSWFSLSSVSVPPGWKCTQDFSVDISGVSNAKCDGEGWIYQTDFAPIYSDLARGKVRISPSPRWFVRRRRWYRRRVRIPADEPDANDETNDEFPDWLVCEGWLGVRGILTGRWVNKYCALINTSEEDDMPGPHIAFFRSTYIEHAKDGSKSLPWTELTTKHIKYKLFDQGTIINDTIATTDTPGYFSVHLPGEEEPRLFNAQTAENKDRWINEFRRVIAASPERCKVTITHNSKERTAHKKFAYAKKKLGTASSTVVAARNTFVEAVGRVRSRNNIHANDDNSRQFDEAMSPLSESATEPGGVKQGSKILGLSPSKAFKSISTAIKRTTMTSSRKISSESPMVPPKTGPLPISVPSIQLEQDSPTKLSDTHLAPIPAIGPPVVRRATSVPNEVLESNISPIVKPVQMIKENPCDDPETAAINAATEVANKQSEGTYSKSFEIVEAFDTLGFDNVFPMSVDEFNDFFFQKTEFHTELMIFEGMTEIVISPWSTGFSVGSEQRRQYMMPKKGLVPKNTVFQIFKYEQSLPGKGYQVDMVCSNPGVPNGSCFQTELRQIAVAVDENKCRVIISFKVTFLKSTLAKIFIVNSVKGSLTSYYKELWPNFISEWLLKNKGIKCFDKAVGNDMLITKPGAPPAVTGEGGNVEAKTIESSASVVTQTKTGVSAGNVQVLQTTVQQQAVSLSPNNQIFYLGSALLMVLILLLAVLGVIAWELHQIMQIMLLQQERKG